MGGTRTHPDDGVGLPGGDAGLLQTVTPILGQGQVGPGACVVLSLPGGLPQANTPGRRPRGTRAAARGGAWRPSLTSAGGPPGAQPRSVGSTALALAGERPGWPLCVPLCPELWRALPAAPAEAGRGQSSSPGRLLASLGPGAVPGSAHICVRPACFCHVSAQRWAGLGTYARVRCDGDELGDQPAAGTVGPLLVHPQPLPRGKSLLPRLGPDASSPSTCKSKAAGCAPQPSRVGCGGARETPPGVGSAWEPVGPRPTWGPICCHCCLLMDPLLLGRQRGDSRDGFHVKSTGGPRSGRSLSVPPVRSVRHPTES